MKKIIITLAVGLLLLGGISVSAEQSVNVQIAPFDTEINYQKVDNRHIEYPLIVYKDITYFPMTYDLCQSLGLMTGYTEKDGLYITSQPTENYSTAERQPYGGKANNKIGQSYSATIPEYPIYLNGVRIYNNKEEYPLLNFRWVTYFPMTWRFAYDEMGFDINWSDATRSFKLNMRDGNTVLYPLQATSNGVDFVEFVDVYDNQYDANGNITGATLLYSYQKGFFFDIANKKLTGKEFPAGGSTEGKLYDITTATKEIELKTEIKNNGIYADGLLLKQFNSDNKLTYAVAHKTEIGNNMSLIRLSADFGDAPAPYTEKGSYVFEIKGNNVRELDFDKLHNIKGIFDMGDKVYVAANGYRATGSSRWSNSFSDVFIYNKKDGSFTSMVMANKDAFNSIEFLGYTNGKLYVKAMWYNSDKAQAGTNGLPTFSTVNGGFYSVNVVNDKLTKLYPYIRGEYFVFPDGNLYAVADYSSRPQLINLCTGEAHRFE